MMRLEAHVEARDERVPYKRSKALLYWLVFMVLIHSFSPLLLVVLLAYQFCCVQGAQRVSSPAKVVCCIAAVVLAVAWVPLCNVALFIHSKGQYSTNDAINAFGPLVVHTVAVVWGSVVAFRLFSLADSFESELERPQIRRLAEAVLTPPLEVAVSVASPSRQIRERQVISTALELFQHLSGEWHFSSHAAAAVVLLTVGSMLATHLTPSSSAVGPGAGPSTHHVALGVLATIYFTAMSFALILSLAHIITLYVHKVNFICRLSYAIDVDASRSQAHQVVNIDVFNIGQLWIWEECRRLAVEELTSSKSILNAVLTPTMWLCAFCSIAVFGDVVVCILFLGLPFSRLETGLSLLLALSVSFIGVMTVIAKLAQGHFKRQAALIAHRTFDVARIIDVYYTNAMQGIGTIEDHETRAALFGGSGKLTAGRQGATPSTTLGHARVEAETGPPGCPTGGPLRATADEVGDDDRDWEAEHDKQLLTLPKLERVYASLHSICTFMVADQPSPLLLGVELQHVRFVLVFGLLLSSNVLFVSLMVAFKAGKCHNGGSPP